MVTSDWANFRLVTSILAAVSCLYLSLLVYFKNKDRQANRIFATSNLILALWNISDFIVSSSTNYEVALFVDRLSYIWGIFVVPLFFYLCLDVAGNSLKSSRFAQILWIVAGILSVLAFTPLLILEVKLKPHFQEIPGPAYYLFIFYFVSWLGYGLYKVFKSYRLAAGIKKNQIRYMLAGLFFAFLAGISYFACMLDPGAPALFYLFELAYTSIVAYAIIRYRLMDINLALRYTTIYLLFVCFVGAPLIVISYLFKSQIVNSLLILIAIMFGHTMYIKISNRLTFAVDRLPIFKGKYDKVKDLEAHQKNIGQARSVDEWAWRLVQSANDLFQSKTINLMLDDSSLKSYHIKAGVGLNAGEMAFLELAYNNIIVTSLQKEKSVLVKEYLSQTLTKEDYKTIQNEMEFIHAELVVPMFRQNKLIAILNIGKKNKSEMFNDLDLAALWGLARAAEETLRAILLGMEMRQYTQDWIHDLLHPFGAKGSLKFVREAINGHFGPISEELKTALMLVWNDGQFIGKHLTKIIHPSGHDLGEMYNFQRQPLTKVFSRMREKYAITALEEGIKWVVNMPPENFIVECDWEMIEYRVITNLIENAFRYTPKGGTIELGYKISDGEFCGYVRDTGVGIPKDKQSKIFERGVQGEESNRGTAGLGLSNVATVMTGHHGRVWVESEVGKGSTFFFSLPLAKN